MSKRRILVLFVAKCIKAFFREFNTLHGNSNPRVAESSSTFKWPTKVSTLRVDETRATSIYRPFVKHRTATKLSLNDTFSLLRFSLQLRIFFFVLSLPSRIFIFYALKLNLLDESIFLHNFFTYSEGWIGQTIFPY